jgi:hypothetical protein
MLGRKGHDAILIDPHKHYPPDFRCEKLDASQIDLLRARPGSRTLCFAPQLSTSKCGSDASAT